MNSRVSGQCSYTIPVSAQNVNRIFHFEFKYLITYLIFTENSRSVKKCYISNTVFINVSHR